MTPPTVLVLTPVHHPDDPRIREKLLRSLAGEVEVIFAAPEPGPADSSGLRWVPLRGGRLARNLAAWQLAFFSQFHLLSLHDAETLPLGLAVAWLRRRPVVFDVHENIPELAMQRAWVPEPLRGPLRWMLRQTLFLAERSLAITLAEPGYQALFRKKHPSFPNHLPTSLPPVREPRDGYAVYVGDITEERGVDEAVEATSSAGLPLVLVGRVSDGYRASLEAKARKLGVKVTFHGWLSHPQALQVMGGAVAGLSPIRDLPNYRDSLPTKVFEYLALGVPVVATDLPGTRKALEGLGAVELVPPGDALAMAAALRRAPDQVPAATHQAERVRERFQWPSRAVRDFYRKLVLSFL